MSAGFTLPLAAPPRCAWRSTALFVGLSLGLAYGMREFASPFAHGWAVMVWGGIFLGVLLAIERQTWMRWCVVALWVEGLANYGIWGEGLLESLAVALGHVGGLWLAALLVTRYCGSPFQLQSTRDVLALALFSMVPGAAFSAGVESVVGLLDTGSFSVAAWARNWTGYGLCGLIVAPLVVTLSTRMREPVRIDTARCVELLTLLTITVAVTHLIFSTRVPLLFLLLPLLIWNALRFDMAAIAIGGSVVAAMAIHHTALGWGPFGAAGYSMDVSAILAQSFMCVASFVGMMLSSVMSQRRMALEALRCAHEETEARVVTRTTELRASEGTLRTLLDTIPDLVRLKDAQGRYVKLNRAAIDALGMPESQLIGKTVFEVRSSGAATRIDAEFQRALASDKPLRIEGRSTLRPAVWRETLMAPIRQADGVVSGVVSITRDITERHQAQLDALRVSEERYRTLVEQASDMIYRADFKGFFTYVNADAVRRVFGYSEQDLIGHQYLEFIHPDSRAETQAFYERQFRERIAATYFETRALTKDGRTLWIGQHVRLHMKGRYVMYLQAVCRDISERVAAQQALRASNEKLRHLAARQEALVEDERTRIARDLHDGIGQSLNLARIKLAEAVAQPVAGATLKTLGEIVAIIDQTSAHIRTLEFDLSPPLLRELGLTPALEWLAEEMKRVYGLQVDLSDDGTVKPLNQAQRLIVFRSVREALINVVRHAHTPRAHVDTQRADERLVVTISDEGSGFDMATLIQGFGLASVRERMEHAGGTLDVRGAPSEGALVTLSLPLLSPLSPLSDDQR